MYNVQKSLPIILPNALYVNLLAVFVAFGKAKRYNHIHKKAREKELP